MKTLAQAPDRPAKMPSKGVLALHNQHSIYTDFAEFQPELPKLLQKGKLLEECVQIIQVLGILEPLTGEHIPPEALLISGPNWRESLIGNGLLSRNRAMLWLLEHLYESVDVLKSKDIYLVEALSGFALWLRRELGEERLTCSEFLEGAEEAQNSGINHEDLCALSFSNESFDLVLCNELFEHVAHLDSALSQIARVLRPGGRLVATCPLAFGQQESIVKAVADEDSGELKLLGEAEMHGDPIRPSQGSLVYRIPGWEILGQLQVAGFSKAQIHHVCSWKNGVLGADLPGVAVIHAEL